MSFKPVYLSFANRTVFEPNRSNPFHLSPSALAVRPIQVMLEIHTASACDDFDVPNFTEELERLFAHCNTAVSLMSLKIYNPFQRKSNLFTAISKNIPCNLEKVTHRKVTKRLPPTERQPSFTFSQTSQKNWAEVPIREHLPL